MSDTISKQLGVETVAYLMMWWDHIKLLTDYICIYYLLPSMKNFIMSHYKAIIKVTSVAILLLILVPFVAKQIQLVYLRTQIEIIETKIEKNKHEWLSCEANMKMRNNENTTNREMVNELKTKYNEMVGFTSEVVSQ